MSRASLLTTSACEAEVEDEEPASAPSAASTDDELLAAAAAAAGAWASEAAEAEAFSAEAAEAAATAVAGWSGDSGLEPPPDEGAGAHAGAHAASDSGAAPASSVSTDAAGAATSFSALARVVISGLEEAAAEEAVGEGKASRSMRSSEAAVGSLPGEPRPLLLSRLLTCTLPHAVHFVRRTCSSTPHSLHARIQILRSGGGHVALRTGGRGPPKRRGCFESSADASGEAAADGGDEAGPHGSSSPSAAAAVGAADGVGASAGDAGERSASTARRERTRRSAPVAGAAAGVDGAATGRLREERPAADGEGTIISASAVE